MLKQKERTNCELALFFRALCIPWDDSPLKWSVEASPFVSMSSVEQIRESIEECVGTIADFIQRCEENSARSAEIEEHALLAEELLIKSNVLREENVSLLAQVDELRREVLRLQKKRQEISNGDSVVPSGEPCRCAPSSREALHSTDLLNTVLVFVC
jgi:hypothetical protein